MRQVPSEKEEIVISFVSGKKLKRGEHHDCAYPFFYVNIRVNAWLTI